MLSLLRAESLKIGGNRKVVWPLVWIYPIGALLVLLIVGGVQVWQEANGGAMVGGPKTVEGWLDDYGGIWSAPASVRFLMIAFAAVVFGGEYGWNTWKLVAPHRGRTELMLSKHLSTIGWLMAGYVVMAVVWVLGVTVIGLLLGDPPRGVPFGAVLGGQGEGALFALLTTALTVALTAVLVVATRSTVGALVIGIVLTVAEPLIVPRLAQIDDLFLRLSPGMALGNLQSWIFNGQALTLPTPDGLVSDSWVFSLTVVLAWTAALAGLSVALFRRQDLN